PCRKPNTPRPPEIPKSNNESVVAGGGTQKRVRAVPDLNAVSENGTRISCAPARDAERIESAPTPQIVSFSPYLTVLGRTLSISSGADTRNVSSPLALALSKFAAAARITAVPEFTPTICPALSTVATAGLLLDQTKLTLGIRCESPGATTCQAVALAVVSLPRINILRRVTLTCTEESRSVGKTHVASVAELNSTASAALPRRSRRGRGQAQGGPIYTVRCGRATTMPITGVRGVSIPGTWPPRRTPPARGARRAPAHRRAACGPAPLPGRAAAPRARPARRSRGVTRRRSRR